LLCGTLRIRRSNSELQSDARPSDGHRHRRNPLCYRVPRYWAYQAHQGVLNFVVITAALSAFNSGLNSTERMLLSLAQNQQAPARFARISKDGGVPYMGILFSAGAISIGVLLDLLVPGGAYTRTDHDMDDDPHYPMAVPASEDARPDKPEPAISAVRVAVHELRRVRRLRTRDRNDGFQPQYSDRPLHRIGVVRRDLPRLSATS
jgi:hypothetical protein